MQIHTTTVKNLSNDIVHMANVAITLYGDGELLILICLSLSFSMTLSPFPCVCARFHSVNTRVSSARKKGGARYFNLPVVGST